VAADSNNDIITIGHSYSSQAAHDFNNTTDVVIASALDGSVQTDNSIVLPFLKTDNAGHIIGYSTNKFYIPHTFKTVKVAAQSTVSTAVDPSTSEGNLVAENIVDTLTIATGNKWVQTTTDENNDKITFSHILSGVTKNTYGTNSSSAIEPKFGDTFEVPGYDVDEAGHIISSTTHTVKIPQASYSDNQQDGNVMVGFELTDDTTSAFKGTHAYVGSLELTGYTVDDNITAIGSGDTINSAFAKSEARLADEAKTRASEDERILGLAKDHTNQIVTELINEAPDALNTLGELAAALKNKDEEISTTIVSMITSNTKLINENKTSIGILSVDLADELKVRASEDARLAETISREASLREARDQGLMNNITAEKTSREEADKNLQKNIDAEIAAREESVKELSTMLEEEVENRKIDCQTQYDALAQKMEDNVSDLDLAIKTAVQNVLNDILTNYNIALNTPEFEVIVDEEIPSLTVRLLKYTEYEAEYTYSWYKK
jgi:hypothetical protein